MRRLAALYNRHFILGTLALLALAGGVLWAVHTAVDWSRYAAWHAEARLLPRTPPSQQPPAGSASAVIAFRYRDATRFVRVPIVERELAAARSLRTDRGYKTRGEVRASYMRALVRASARSYAVDGMAADLRVLRAKLGLDSDEYVELMTRMVQSIPYGTARPEFGLPVEVAVDGRAVCADKSVLLAALLLHEGYDTGVWILDSQLHASAAVRGIGPGYLSSGYAFVETTARSYVGETPERYAGNGPWAFEPQLVRVGGHTRYTCDVENQFIAAELHRASKSAHDLEPFHRYLLAATPYQARNYASFVRRQVSDSRFALRLESVADDHDVAWRLVTANAGR